MEVEVVGTGARQCPRIPRRVPSQERSTAALCPGSGTCVPSPPRPSSFLPAQGLLGFSSAQGQDLGQEGPGGAMGIRTPAPVFLGVGQSSLKIWGCSPSPGSCGAAGLDLGPRQSRDREGEVGAELRTGPSWGTAQREWGRTDSGRPPRPAPPPARPGRGGDREVLKAVQPRGGPASECAGARPAASRAGWALRPPARVSAGPAGPGRRPEPRGPVPLPRG